MDKDVWTSMDFKCSLALAVDKFPRAKDNLQAVFLQNVIKHPALKTGVAIGVYDMEKKLIALAVGGRSSSDILSTFHHELGHAIDMGLSADEDAQWARLYTKKLRADGYEKPLGPEKWMRAPVWKSFPSRYCLHSQGEYFAEHIQEVAKDEVRHLHIYPQEHQLIRDMGILPKDPTPIPHFHVELQDAVFNSSSRYHPLRVLRCPTPRDRRRYRFLRGRPNQRAAA